MIRLCLASPGTGKSHWLESQPADVRVDCTNKSHRAVLCAIADALRLEYPARASIDDLLTLILGTLPCVIALDNIDRTAAKLCYSLLLLAQKHEICCTATEKRRIRPLLDRQAAIIVPVPPAPIADIVASHYPALTPTQVRRIAAVAHTPAAALNIARSVHDGQPLPTAPTTSVYPILIIASLAILAFIRYYSDWDLSPVTLAIISAGALYLRRLLWSTRTM